MSADRLVIITGPECSGKTTLAKKMAKENNAALVPELARTYLENQNNKYDYADLLKIAELQFGAISKALKTNAKKIICDTDLLTIVIWSEEKFGKVDGNILKLYEKQAKGLYLLCTPSIPWVYDPQRENPNDRDRLFDLYKAKLLELGAPFEIRAV